MYLLTSIRALFVLLAFFVGLGIQNAFQQEVPQEMWFPLLMAALAACLVAVEIVFQKKYLAGLVAIFFGLILGLVATFITTLLLAFLLPPAYYSEFIRPLVPVISLFLCYLAVTIVFQTRDRLRFVVPYMAFSNLGRKRGGLLLDTSVFVDGRILDLCHSSLISDELIVPSYVLKELQALSDSEESIKRARGRRGLDVLGKLRGNTRMILRIEEADYPELSSVDAKLVRMARERDAIVLTGDLNLAKVARVEGVETILLQELAVALRPIVTPGDRLTVHVLRPGEERDQGVGYLEDGTMVVVEAGRGVVGRDVQVEVQRLLTTHTGRIVFARMSDGAGHSRDSEKGLRPASNSDGRERVA
ncbi:MAG: PIN/TRAM domain-containing protein [Planctomycetes bacterium]|nr:PIN/TRAM domain-containing protein [Planctomycetota bacterium]